MLRVFLRVRIAFSLKRASQHTAICLANGSSLLLIDSRVHHNQQAGLTLLKVGLLQLHKHTHTRACHVSCTHACVGIASACCALSV